MHGEREATKEQVFRDVTATCIRDLRQADAAALFMVSIPLVLNLTRRPAGHRQGNGTDGMNGRYSAGSDGNTLPEKGR
ncbi:hypothetical protein ABH15_08635 [Methanoculleus taiwanensis]|uniref:Uncharacterized protein n=1 Tax=Methanoculleus taiwanensis TaxID=1550565 RepID=A0A498H1I9_9EURY|nr:hypothetical protein [Methanoculleus taiwanensis]RXE56205.1 hypothetical protein ABH15_08635 [Methanoculleus taiwanensis]